MSNGDGKSKQQGLLHRIEAVYDALSCHIDQKQSSLPLIPTENIMSPLARAPLATDLVNRYFLLDNTVWEYPQGDFIHAVHDICEASLQELYKIRRVNIRPISGLNCMTVVLAGLTKPGDVVLTMSPDDGGHGATKVVAERLGLSVVYLPFDCTALDFSLPSARRLIDTMRPSLIYVDMPNFLFPVNIRALRELAPEETFIYFDCSHIMGLLADPGYWNPLQEGLTLAGGSTHKTFPGPQKGILFSNDVELMDRLEKVTNSFVSSHHVNSVFSLCIAAIEMLTFGDSFSKQVRTNALTLATALSSLGVPVQAKRLGFTGSHQLWIDSAPYANEPSQAVALLKDANIVVNCARIPTLRGQKGLRLGTTAVTRLGMQERDMAAVAELINATLTQSKPVSVLRAEVERFRSRFRTLHYCFQLEDTLKSRVTDALSRFV